MNNIRLKLSSQRAMLGNVIPHLRAVCVDWKENLISVIGYYDGEISEEDDDLLQCIFDEIIADFVHEDKIEFDVRLERFDYPNKMPLIGEWTYYRNEPQIFISKDPFLTKESYLAVENYLIDKKVNNLKLALELIEIRLSVQRALLGRIFTKLRAVCVKKENNKVVVIFYIQGEINSFENELCSQVTNEIMADFCANESISYAIEKKRLDFPEKPILIGNWVYHKHEPSPET